MKNLAPIVLFVYNRPEHTLKTLQALANNELADQSDLYIFADGCKDDATEVQKKLCKRVLAVLPQFEQKFKAFTLELSPTNKGLANSIIYGVSKIVHEYGRVIVLEDDLVTSSYFLEYMNNCLLFYEEKFSVFSISGYSFPQHLLKIPIDYSYDVYCCLRNSSYGWATWSNRWSKVDWEMTYYNEFISDKAQIEAFNRGGSDLTPMLTMQKNGKIDSWSIRFSFAHFAHFAVSIVPVHSLVQNIGFDGSGAHSVKSQKYNSVPRETKVSKYLNILYLDKKIIESFRKCFSIPSLGKRILNKITNRIR